jgi:hypothetical protein
MTGLEINRILQGMEIPRPERKAVAWRPRLPRCYDAPVVFVEFVHNVVRDPDYFKRTVQYELPGWRAAAE